MYSTPFSTTLFRTYFENNEEKSVFTENGGVGRLKASWKK